MKVVKKLGIQVARKLLSPQLVSTIITRLADLLRINLLELAQKKSGILNYANSEISGEKYFIEDFLKNHFKKIKEQNLLFFDVGANVGKYTKSLKDSFPEALVYSFEPNPNSFEILENNVGAADPAKIKLFSTGLSSFSGSMVLTSYMGQSSSSHTSLHKEVFEEFHHSSNNVSINAEFTTIDRFCNEHHIEKIHLLKIDTEGHELEVLKGASELINRGGIEIIQFEFGECHVYSRVFLRDFYLVLKDYKFYRLLPNKLLPLGSHSPSLEIFRFQNIIAIK